MGEKKNCITGCFVCEDEACPGPFPCGRERNARQIDFIAQVRRDSRLVK